MKRVHETTPTSRRGSTMVMVAMLVGTMAVLSFALVSIVSSASKALRGSRNDLNAIYISEAAIGDAIFSLANGGDGNVGSENNPIEYGGSEYWVQATDMGDGLTSLISNGEDNGAVARLELIVRSNASADNLYQWAAFGRDAMTMASNSQTDSYDSSAGSYADQEVNGNGTDTYANTDGDIGSNLDIKIVQNTNVYGDLIPGPDGTPSVAGTATVSGSRTSSESEVVFPPLEVPTTVSMGDWTVSGSETLASGDYAFDDVSIGGILTIVGPATIVVTNLSLKANQEIIVDATMGPVEIFVLEDFDMNSNTLISSTTGNPADLALYLESDNIIDPDVDVALDPDNIDFDSNSELFGTIYAPNAHIEIDSNFRLYGSLVARSVHLDSNSKVHFDEALLNVAVVAGSNGAYETICWRILPDDEVIVWEEGQAVQY
jgi:hypothetical protein